MLLVIIILLAVIAVGLFGIGGVMRIAFSLVGLGLAVLVALAAVAAAALYATHHPKTFLVLLACIGAVLVIWINVGMARYLRERWRNHQRSTAINAEVVRQNRELALIEEEGASSVAVMRELDHRISEDLAHQAKMEAFREEQRTMRAKRKWK